MKCQVCGQETHLPFRCPFCGGQFCSAHRLPENHECPRIDFARTKTRTSYVRLNHTILISTRIIWPAAKTREAYTFSPKELKHITVAARLSSASASPSACTETISEAFNFPWTWAMMAVFAAIMTVSFLSHEFAHKVMAQKNGLWAEFRLTTWGAVLTFVSIFLPFRMIAPGAMMIAGTPNGDEIVKISIAGPITNLIFSSALLGVAFAFPPSGLAVCCFSPLTLTLSWQSSI